MGIKGYKVFNPDWTCRDFKYEVGKEYVYNGNIEMCKAGFHFCQKASDCFNYYNFDSRNKVAEVEATGLVETNGNKSVTDRILILKELPWREVLDIVNEGKNCTGLCNTGNRNTGDCNTGVYNTGSYNTGSYNTGSCNTGSYNTGSCNTGDYNTGSCNTGNYNTGVYNTGDWNTSDFSTGFFNSKEQPIFLFNKPTKLTRQEILSKKGMSILNWNFENNWWIYSENMTSKEKQQHPEYETTGGYLKTVDFKTACGMMWNNLDDEEKQAVKDMPNFDIKVFEKITGIRA